MFTGTLAFLLGVVLFTQLSSMPAMAWSGILLLILPVLSDWRLLRFPLLLVCGFLWALVHAGLTLQHELPAVLEGKELTVMGQVASLPIKRDDGVEFQFDVSSLRGEGKDWPSPGRVLLNWQTEQATALKPGQMWRLDVKLKRPHGLMNPGGFDKEQQLFLQGVRAKGYVRPRGFNQRLGDSVIAGGIDRWRQSIGQNVSRVLADSPFYGIILALANGEQHSILDAHWQTLRETGTIHLMSISGLHVSLVAAMSFWLFSFVWRHTGLTRTLWPSDRIAALGAMILATLYSAMAGFSIPTQRSLIMVAVALLAILLRRTAKPMHVLACALLLVLLYDPFAVLSIGFWLSFVAVFLLMYGMQGRVIVSGLWWKWGRVHWVATLGLTPALLYTFHYTPLASVLANFIAVPWTSFTTVPLSLFGALLQPVWQGGGDALIELADGSIAVLWPLMTWLQHLQLHLQVANQPPLWSMLLAAAGVLLLLAPSGFPCRWLGGLWCLPMLWLPVSVPVYGEAWFTLLDVGQGLSAVIKTRNHALVYDTGPGWGEEYDTGKAVLIPFLQHEGINRVDTLMLSHGDNDHIGGARSLLKGLPVTTIIGAQPESLAEYPMQRCQQGQGWVWDGVTFEVIYPRAGDQAGEIKDNNLSCVLRVSNSGGAILLAGDIEADGEQRLLAVESELLPADVLVAPHHGSNTSSTQAFIEAVSPRYVLFPVGYQNRYRFPNSKVTARYAKLGVKSLDTAKEGAISVVLKHDKGVSAPRSYRAMEQHIWHWRSE